MKMRIAAFLPALALAGLFALPALAGDEPKGEPRPSDGCKATKIGECAEGAKEGAKKECPEGAKKEVAGDAKEGCTDGKEGCGDDGASCPGCVEGAREGKDCCAQKMARSDIEVVTLAAVEGTSEVAKKVLASIPPASLEKVEAARKAAFEQLAKIQGAMAELKEEFDAACAEAKAKGADVGCDLKATFESDMKTLHARAKEQVEICAKTIRESLGEEKVKELSADCRKAGDMAKAVGAKVRAAAAKFLEKRKAGGEGECEDAAGDGKCGEGGKAEDGDCGKKCEGQKPAGKDPQ